MKAIVQDKYGSAEVLRFEDIDPPEIGDNDVLVHVRAAGVDRGVWHFMTGRVGAAQTEDPRPGHGPGRNR